MRVISKQISLEDFTSRLPGVVPAYIPGSKEPIFFDDTSLSERDYAYPSNYGLIPMSVNINGSCLSWERVSDMYHFFTDYFHLLNDWGHCGRSYTSATTYYDNESKNGYASQLIYGTDRQTYVDLDSKYSSLSGYWDGIQKCIPSMDIPKDYTDYWKATKLFYPDIVKWNGWFKERVPKYGNISLSSCSGTSDCCDCTEYVNRGGKTMADLLANAYSSIQSTISSISTCDNQFVIPLSLQVSIDDLGEFSIFSEEYKLGIDYRGASGYGATENTEVGTVVAISGQAKTLVSGPGFKYDPVYMEKIFDENAWKTHKGDKRIDGIPEEDDNIRAYQGEYSNYYYGFNSDMEKVTGSSIDEVKGLLATSYIPSPVNGVFIDGVLYNIFNEEYGYYKGNASLIYPVYREEYTNTPYVFMNGKKIYGDARPQSKSSYYYFPFFASDTSQYNCVGNTFNPGKYKWFPKERTGDTKNFIKYGGGTYEVTDDTITINWDEYFWVIGEFSNSDGQFYVGRNGIVYMVVGYGILEEASNYTYEDGEVKRIIDNDVQVFESGYVSGKTASRLYGLRANDTLVDDSGEPIEGRYDVSGKANHQPPQGTELDLLYEKGNTANMTPYEIKDTCAREYGSTYYCGDMITDMKFYYVNYAGEKQTEYSWAGSSLSTINSMSIPDDTNTDIVWCDIEYVLGGTWVGTKRYKNGLYVGMTYSKPEGNFNPGVTYNETVRFVKTQVEYRLAKGKDGQIPVTFNEPTAHTLSYPVVCYILEQDEQEINSDYGNTYSYPVATFRMRLPSNGGWCGYGTNTEIFPVFRQEYLLGSSTMQKLDVDIYIDRGINAAFEKHLKLGEVTSMEALENYSNGYFRMMDN